jgi:hypothetical protein
MTPSSLGACAVAVLQKTAPGSLGSKLAISSLVHRQAGTFFTNRGVGRHYCRATCRRGALGIFCLDELPEFRRHVIEVLCQPIEKMS